MCIESDYGSTKMWCCLSTFMALHSEAGYTLFVFRMYFANVFAKHTTKYETLTTHYLYFMRILCFINAMTKINHEIL